MTASKEFSDLVVASLPALTKNALKLTRNVTEASDLVQETALRALKYHYLFDPGSNFGGWAFTIMRNLYTQNHRRVRKLLPDIDGLLTESLAAPDDQFKQIEFLEVMSVVNKMPADQRDALLAVALGDRYDEAAARLGTFEGTIKSRVHRGKEFLKERLG